MPVRSGMMQPLFDQTKVASRSTVHGRGYEHQRLMLTAVAPGSDLSATALDPALHKLEAVLTATLPAPRPVNRPGLRAGRG